MAIVWTEILYFLTMLDPFQDPYDHFASVTQVSLVNIAMKPMWKDLMTIVMVENSMLTTQ